MDIGSLNRRAARVSGIFNVLANFVVVLGGIGIVIALIAAFASGNGGSGVATGLLLAVGIAIYVVLIWAGIQLSSLVAGYIYTRTTDSDLG
jgi:uncharacterized oligopeptide transporter (OPT) family protein